MNKDKLKTEGIPFPTPYKPVRPLKVRLLRIAVGSFLLGAFYRVATHSWSYRTESRHHQRHGPLRGKDAEKLFLSVPDEETSNAALRQFASRPHMAGDRGDYATAIDFLDILQRELGIPVTSDVLPIYPAGSPESQHATMSTSNPHDSRPRAWIDTYYPVMNTPNSRSLQVLDSDGHVIWEADLSEHADPLDPEAGKYSDAIAAFHGLSASGDVTGRLIYVNYGSKEDYDELVAKGVDFKGAIVIARYGGIFRGLKIKGAEELGAIGVLIYSDPRDDGPITIQNGYKPYPHGPARNPTSLQRGSVQYISIYPGDPTTPGYPAYENSTRTNGDNIPTIPSLPISWANAETLLEKVTEQGVTVHMINDVDTKVTPIWNVMATIPGHIKDEIIVVGNHRDAWVMGAADPTSGTVATYEVVRGLGVLLRKGWKPLRTIVLASWDAEEYGLIGSTEWGEDFAEWIDKNVAAYLNVDVAASGSRFGAQASPLLAHLVQGTAEEIPHPTDKKRTLWDASKDSGVLTGDFIDVDFLATEKKTLDATVVDALGVGILGSGSDYTVFLQRLGIASLNHGFSASVGDPVYHYHSVYDSAHWMELYGDPGFHRHVAVAKHLGLLTLRLSGELVLPMNTTHYAVQLENYLNKVESLFKPFSLDIDLSALRKSIYSLQAASRSLDYEKRDAERELEHALKNIMKEAKKLRKAKRRARKAICKIRKATGKPCKEHEHDAAHHPHHYEHSAIHAGEIIELQELEWLIASRLSQGRGPHCRHPGLGAPWPHLPIKELKRLGKAYKRVKAVNHKLISFERGFISEEGIPQREWYRHLGVAPGKWLGYGATTLPALTEAITIENNATLAQYEAKRLEEAVDKIADAIRLHE